MFLKLDSFIVLFLAVGVFALAQKPTTESPRLLNTLDHPNCEYLSAYLDLFPQLIEDQAVGHIIFQGGRNPITNRAYEKYLQAYFVGRHLNTDKVSIITAKPGDKIRFEFWISFPGFPPDIQAFELSRQLDGISDPIYFDGDLFESFVEKGKRIFVGLGCQACCITSLDWSTLSEFLMANSGTNAYVLIRGPRSRARQLRSYLAREIRESGITPARVKYIFAPRNLLNSKHFNEVEVLVSRKRSTSAADLAPKGSGVPE